MSVFCLRVACHPVAPLQPLLQCLQGALQAMRTDTCIISPCLSFACVFLVIQYLLMGARPTIAEQFWGWLQADEGTPCCAHEKLSVLLEACLHILLQGCMTAMKRRALGQLPGDGIGRGRMCMIA